MNEATIEQSFTTNDSNGIPDLYRLKIIFCIFVYNIFNILSLTFLLHTYIFPDTCQAYARDNVANVRCTFFINIFCKYSWKSKSTIKFKWAYCKRSCFYAKLHRFYNMPCLKVNLSIWKLKRILRTAESFLNIRKNFIVQLFIAIVETLVLKNCNSKTGNSIFLKKKTTLCIRMILFIYCILFLLFLLCFHQFIYISCQ